jgi:hypothetical protein
MSSPVRAFALAGDPFFRRPPRLPGSAPESEASAPTPSPRLPGSSTPSPRLPARRPGCPACLPSPLLPPPKVHQLGSGPSSNQTRFRLVNPVGPPIPLHRHCWPLWFLSTVPRVPVGVRFPVRSTHCTLRFRRSRGIFGTHRVIHEHCRLLTEVSCSSTVRPQVVHRFDVDVPPFCGLNGARVRARSLRDHHHLLAHLGPMPMCAPSRPSGRLFHFPGKAHREH